MYGCRLCIMATSLTFLKEVKAELTKVIWPTRKETVRLTLLVIAVSVGVGVFIGGLDILFIRIVDTLLR